MKYLGIELWQVCDRSIFPILVIYINYFHIINVPWLRLQVKSRTLFDNILVCDDPEYAKKLEDETWGNTRM